MDSVPAPLKGKVAIVTGGSRGIGAAIAETFAKNGCTHIGITYNSNKSLAEDTEKKMASINSKIKTFSLKTDICDAECGRYTVEESLKGLGVDHIDIMVSCAALAEISTFQTAEAMTKEHWDRMMTADAWTPFALARESAKVMPEGGRIIMISSGASRGANGDPLIAYSAAKAAMDAVSRNLAAIYGITKKDVTVNSISVGAIQTDALQQAFDTQGPEFRKYIEGFSLLKRVGQPQEIADVVAFIASKGSSYIVGNAVPVNGGGLSALQG
ncbi:hypothetical protein PRZ48_001777 [Zasmidium cellare]|uniref:Uncharacterized protein n=1 Tax=Zasmidium cellare TaxID=395010 RepID=A0ABR0F2W1_ZASCE|nr:hypothetical protein PRZ48_001777 [Zasmidium cellare]